MAFDQTTRNRLQRFVADARSVLTVEFTRQMQNEYGLDPATGSVSPIETLHLDDSRLETARILRDTLDHYRKGSTASDDKQLIEQIAREQAFTVLNRFAALKMAEARGILIQSLDKGYESQGFQLYQNVAGAGLGETGDAYKSYLFSIFDEFAVDLKVLFDRFSPTGLLFPKETVMLELLALVNDREIEPLWSEDETIGWIYQYFNTKEERKKMRDESAAPRNSRELAVRNQFFTPRYVVEFLTDNTLGRTWYEMTQGKTALGESCRYLVRRPKEIFLGDLEQAAKHFGTDLEESGIPDSVRAAFQGDFANAFDERIGSNRWWIGLAIPPDQYETITGIPQKGLDDYPHLGDVWDALDGTNTSEHLLETDSLLAAFSQFILTSSGGPYAIEPTERLWNAISESLVNESGDDASQEELLKRPVYVPFRPLKDPREILMLDPACGSMHFGLYAFDLFLKIYEEAWDLAIPPASTDELKPLRETYDNDKERFLLDVPRLIIENNIHGVDIDPRAVQIAGLSLWLRAQRAWAEQNVKPHHRPQIRRSNIVCAEPMPGEADLLEEFIAKHFADTTEKRLLGAFVRRIFESMKLAGEAGSLLKIEEEVAALISESREQWHELQKKGDEKPVLFDYAPVNPQQSLDFQVGEITEEDFWNRAETEIYHALRRYSEAGENGAGYGRRLFADDAAQGFSFIDLCRKRYDVVVMNPPFGSPAESFEGKEQYPNSGRDIYAMFVERMAAMRTPGGRIGAILPRTGLFIGTMADLRKQCYLNSTPLELLLDLGKDILDGATIRTACYVIGSKIDSITCIRIGNIDERENRVGEVLRSIESGEPNEDLFVRKCSFFKNVPGSAIAYWIPERLSQTLPILETLEVLCDIRQGIATGDNFRFLRLLSELSPPRTGFSFYSKGGEPVPFISDETLYVQSSLACAEMKANAAQEYGSASRTIKNEDTFGLPGITYSQVNDACLKFRVHPPHALYDMKGPVLFPRPGVDKKALLAFLNSPAVEDFMRMMTDGRQWHVSALKNVPVPDFRGKGLSRLTELCERAARLCLNAYTSDEAGHFFAFGSRGEVSKFHRSELDTISGEIDDAVWQSYGATAEEVASFSRQRVLFLERSFSTDSSAEQPSVDAIHLAVGAAFGRWDIRYATGERQVSEMGDPFATLPVCSPGMLQNDQGLPAELKDIPSDYPLDIVWSGILVEDIGNTADIENRLSRVFQLIWKDKAEEVETEACEFLGVGNLRDYFRKPSGFFADHLKRYSKSRRQAPIYLPLSTKSGEYTLWLYYHRLTDQTLFSCINDFVEPKIRQVKDDVNGLSSKQGRSSDDEKRLEQLTDLSFELEELRDELLRLAPIWKPNLNDGVQITMSPLWKRFRLPKWRKTLEDTWKKLEKGEYDWAHLAYSLYPDRVREKCKKDKSLAIAHDLEDLYEEPPSTKKKKGKKAANVENTLGLE